MIKQSDQGEFELDNVSVTFGDVRALSDVSMKINAGERVGFVGPSGAGKTTLLRLLNGTVRPTSGRVRSHGRSVGDLTPRETRELRGQIGFIHQHHGLVANLRVIQNVASGRLGQQSLIGSLRTMLFPNRGEAVAIHEILERVGIEDKLYERTDRLSGGQQQRVAIARALYQEPVALLADEPVASVDPARARDTVSLLCDVSREQGLSLCMSLHNLDLARECFPRLIGLRFGRVVFDEPASSLTDAQFEELYHLEADQILENGVRGDEHAFDHRSYIGE